MVVTPILLRSLGRDQYGALVLLNLMPQIAGQLDLGLSTAGTRAFGHFKARNDAVTARRISTEVTSLLCLWGAIVASLFLAFRGLVANALGIDAVIGDPDSPVYAFAAATLLFALLNTAAAVPLRALEHYATIARIQASAGMVFWLGCAALAMRGSPLVLFVGLGAAVAAGASLALFVAADRIAATRRNVPEAAAAPEREARNASIGAGLRLAPFLKVGGGAFVAQASSLLTYHADKLLVAALVSPAAAGAYTVCASIASKVLMVIAAIATFTFPRAIRLHASGDHAVLSATFATTTRFCVLLAACFAVPIITLAEPFLRLWLGSTFAAENAMALRVLTFGYTIASASVVASNVAVGTGDARMPATFAVIGGLFTLIGCALLAPHFGIVGAAAAAALGMSQALVFNALVARRLEPAAGEASWGFLARVLALGATVAVAASAVLSSPAFLIRSWQALLVAVALTTAAFALLWAGSFGRRREVSFLRHVWTRHDGH